MIKIKFHGVRGSVPSPLTPFQVEKKIAEAIATFHNHSSKVKYTNDYFGDEEALKFIREQLKFSERSTFGGNTTCVEVRVEDKLFVLDMGTGLRELGNSLMKETFAYKGLQAIVLQSHVHWDHIQGFPFLPQLYMSRKKFDNHFSFYGGKDWDKSLEEALHGQMNPPMFPVDFRELSKTSMHMDFNTVYDGLEFGLWKDSERIEVLCRKLNHPQETYGYRMECKGKSLAFCTDHEPYAAVHQPLVELACNVDVFITDCQYTYHEYAGIKSVPKLGWGHSFPEYIAQVAEKAKPKLIVTTHHDPSASDEHITEIAIQVEKLSGIKTIAAYEGLELCI